MKAQSVALAATLVMAAAGSVRAEVLVDFAQGRGYVVGTGRFRAAADAARQMVVTTNGLRVAFDTVKESGYCGWATINVPSALGARRDWSQGPAVLVLSGVPRGKAMRNIALNLTDRDGETFQFMPKNGLCDEDGNLHLTYDFAGPVGRGWGGKQNGVLDKPARLSALNVHFSGPGVGSTVFARMETVPVPPAIVRTVTSREAISLDTTYPGARPFPGAKTLVFTLPPLFSGAVTLTLSSGSTGNASQGKMDVFHAVATNGVARFDLNLPYEKQYEFMRLTGAPAQKAEGVFVQSAAEAMRLEVETGNPLHLVRDERERPVLTVRNPAERAIAWKTTFICTDIFNRRVTIPFDRSVAAGETVRVPVPWPLPAKGLWRVRAKVTGDDGTTAVHETRFAYVDRHDVTPQLEKPHYRIGIHCHGRRYLPHQLDDVVAALVAAGAKLVRTDYGFLFAEVSPREGVRDWKDGDIVLQKLRAAGLSLDIITGDPPRWSWDESAAWTKVKGKRRYGCTRSNPGVFKAFCHDLAARYGANIDYYEIGNEWDLSSTEAFTHDEALAMQREAYEGIHAAYPGACVTPNGWACSSSMTLDKRFNVGMIEHFADHPEWYDAWALHCHGGIGHYQHALDKSFLPMRAARALKTRPWISNETALTSAHGSEDDVARAVWMKPLFAWSRGARDYVWYNLRATGWFDGGEPGYGLMTADLHPRAGYAAFAALTALFHGLTYERALVDEAMRCVFVFAGERAGHAVRVVVGWNRAALDAPTVFQVRAEGASAMLCDMMGNRTPVVAKEGVWTLPLSADPCALILADAKSVAVVPVSLAASPVAARRLAEGVSEERAPDFVLAHASDVHECYAANPETADRIWQGMKDLSAKVWVGRIGSERLVVHVVAQDDVAAAEDALEVTLVPQDGTKTSRVARPKARVGDSVQYDVEFPLPKGPFAFDLRLFDDDGRGRDFWLRLHDESTPAPTFDRP